MHRTQKTLYIYYERLKNNVLVHIFINNEKLTAWRIYNNKNYIKLKFEKYLNKLKIIISILWLVRIKIIKILNYTTNICVWV